MKFHMRISIKGVWENHWNCMKFTHSWRTYSFYLIPFRLSGMKFFILLNGMKDPGVLVTNIIFGTHPYILGYWYSLYVHHLYFLTFLTSRLDSTVNKTVMVKLIYGIHLMKYTHAYKCSHRITNEAEWLQFLPLTALLWLCKNCIKHGRKKK